MRESFAAVFIGDGPMIQRSASDASVRGNDAGGFVQLLGREAAGSHQSRKDASDANFPTSQSSVDDLANRFLAMEANRELADVEDTAEYKYFASVGRSRSLVLIPSPP